MRIGTPFCSHSLNLNPGDTSGLSSIKTLTLSNDSINLFTAFKTRDLSSSLGMIGTITTWCGASSGGSFNPLSSPCAMIIIPTNLVLTPQLV